VLEACKGNKLLGDGGCERNGLNAFDRIHFWRTPVTQACKSQNGQCVPYYRWVSDYIAVLGGR
jgi:putative spermidine/putrescine transport system substrate-binding protein